MRTHTSFLVHALPHRRLGCSASLALLAVCSLLNGCSDGASKTANQPRARRVAEVAVVALQASDQTITVELPGRTTASLTADIRPQVSGIIKLRLFDEGSQVKAGQALYQIEPATYEAAVRGAEAAVTKAQASLTAAKMTAERNAALVEIDAMSKQAGDDSQAALQLARADLGTAQAALATARINLGFTKITAPISGRIDTSAVTPGALVQANQATALATVQQSDPIYVDIPQSASTVLALRREMASGRLSKDTDATVRLVLDDGSNYAHTGMLRVAGAQVNQSSGAVTLRAKIPNPEGLLMPGMYVRAVLAVGTAQKALLVPQQALTRTPAGMATVLLVGAGNKVEMRTVSVGRAIGNAWQVTDGLVAGERVIVEGAQKVSVGDVVKPVPAVLATTPPRDEPALAAQGKA